MHAYHQFGCSQIVIKRHCIATKKMCVGVNEISQFLMENNVLKELHIRYNKFSEEGILMLLRSLRSNKILECFKLGNMTSKALSEKQKLGLKVNID